VYCEVDWRKIFFQKSSESNYKKNFYSRIFPTSSLPKSNQSMNSGLVRSSTMRAFIRCAGLSGTLAICLGVYGSHIMKENTSDELRRVC
jgi:hypothetical protein